MDPNKLTRADLVEFSRNMAAMIAEGKVTGLLPQQVTSIAQAISDASEFLDTAQQKQVAAIAAAHEATAIAQHARVVLLQLIQGAKFSMRGLRSASNEYDALGLDPPVKGRTPVKPQRPLQLSVTGTSNGVAELRYKGNNNPGRVTYQIWARIGGTGPFHIIGFSRRQRFKHTGAKPGIPILYRVRAQAARDQFSAWSNEATIYKE